MFLKDKDKIITKRNTDICRNFNLIRQKKSFRVKMGTEMLLLVLLASLMKAEGNAKVQSVQYIFPQSI